MNEIICPNCNKAFKVDEAGFADIVKQVRDQQFKEELQSRLILADKEKVSAVQIAEANIRMSLQEKISNKENELIELKTQSELAISDIQSKKEFEITQLKARIENIEVEKKLAVNEAVQKVEKERDSLANDVKTKELEKQNIINALKQQYSTELQNKDAIIKYKDDEIARVKDLKMKLSTKMIGETLEQHCEIEFNKLRPTGFQKAYFEKDNNSSSGSKGDYIYKETDDFGNEIISIMFEMKNEGDETATKKKNEDFLKELDKDRLEKNCEYAILVTLLEADNELYNTGIVDVQHKYEKMYVVRPQFFIPIISILRNSAMNSLKYKAELNTIKNQDIDISNFEDKLNSFKDNISKNVISASNHYQKAIEEIDKSIARMKKVKEELTSSEKQLLLANKKSEELTIKKLTHNNQTMKTKFENNNSIN